MSYENIIVHTYPKSPIAEAYRILRTNIRYSNIDRKLKTIVLTSTGPMEGKTTTAVNLAATFANMGSRVLLIDSDLRKPKVHEFFLLTNKKGLTNLIASHRDYKEYVVTCDIPNLDLLTSGIIPPNPSEILSSNSMKQFIQKVSEEYDIVFIDAPPVGIVTDAAIISTYVDGTILVANSGHVEIGAIKQTKGLLEQVNANIVGVVLNKLEKSDGENRYGYQYYYGRKDTEKKTML